MLCMFWESNIDSRSKTSLNAYSQLGMTKQACYFKNITETMTWFPVNSFTKENQNLSMTQWPTEL